MAVLAVPDFSRTYFEPKEACDSLVYQYVE